MTSWNRRTGVEILVVEDSTTQAAQLAAVLENHGYTVTVAVDGEQALAAVCERQPALIISDVVMPRMDGYGLCSSIKQDEAVKHIPIVLLTTLSDPKDVLRGLECGADNFIRKPIDEQYLLSRIDYLLMNRELRVHQKTQLGIEIDLRGQRYFINSDRQQILDLLISTYEQAVDLNKELSQRERELANSNEVLDSLYRIADELNRAVTARKVLETVIDRVMDLPDVHAAWVSVSDQGGPFSVLAARNLPFKAGDSVADPNCQCLTRLRQGSFTAANIYDCGCLREVQEAIPGLHCHATVPLSLADGSKLGVLNLVSPDEYGFDDGQLQLLSGIGNQLAVALERAELHENLERLVDERTVQVVRLNRLYSVLSRINTTIIRVQSQVELFDAVCRIAVDEGAFALAWIATVDANGINVARIACASNNGVVPSPGDLLKAVAEIERSDLLAEALQGRVPAIRNNLVAGEQILSGWTGDDNGFASAAVLPLFRDGSLAGICMLYAAEPGAFDDAEEMHLLGEIAGDIGYALDYQEKERRLNYLAYFDSVTALPNRTLFADRLSQAIQKAGRHRNTVGVAVLDLDRFKTINDSLGHAIGDKFLSAVAERLNGVVRDGDTVARLAGDEFGFIFADLRQEDDASLVINKILECFSLPFVVEDFELFASASLGVTVYPSDGDNPDDLMQSADAAMYRAKAEGGSGYQFYSADMTFKARERLALENDLRRALDKGEFLLHYQPIVDAKSGQITGVEALVRWLNPERGLVSPMDFIPLAEETSMIVDLGAWVMEEACAQVASGWGAAASTLRLAVNVSTRQFLQGDLLDMVARVIERTGIDPTKLTLEITESRLMENIDEMVAVMHQLGALGIRFSIDDFGTGYSSLAYLKNLPISNLKVDRSFVRSLPDNADDAAIVKTVISMAHSLGRRVIAEGVETKEQLEFLQTHGCDAIQGYYFSKPLPADELFSLLGRGVSKQ